MTGNYEEFAVMDIDWPWPEPPPPSSEPLLYGLGPAPPYDPDVMTYQAFTVTGIRFVYPGDYYDTPATYASVRQKQEDLRDTLAVWLAIQMPVRHWRVVPEMGVQKDFATDRFEIRIRARGFFDTWLLLREHTPWFVELP